MTIFSQVMIGLVTAHLIGDFVIQTRNISENKHKWNVLIVHTLAIAALSWLLCGIWQNWPIPVAVFIIHTMLDFIKSRFLRNDLAIFLLDQTLHLLSLLLIAMLIQVIPVGKPVSVWPLIFGEGYWRVLVIISGFAVAVRMSAFIIQFTVAPLEAELQKAAEKQERVLVKGLQGGGQWIGQLERALIMLFYLSGQGAGIGFLIAAKSILRYGEVRSRQDKMRAEYIIIGTLLSFGIGVLVAVLTGYILAKI